jgi:hypothetical protein
VFVFLALVVVVVAVWLGFQLLSQSALDDLKTAGFAVDYSLGASPQAVFDAGRKEVAFIRLNETLVYQFDQVLNWDYEPVQGSGWSNKGEPEEKYRINFYLEDDHNPVIRVEAPEGVEIELWRDRLKTLLAKNPGGPQGGASP